MTTPHLPDTLRSALATTSLRQIERARVAHADKIQEVHAARQYAALTRATALLASKPDPASWTPEDHCAFLDATHGDLAVMRTSTQPPPHPTPPSAVAGFDKPLTDEIPF